MVKREVRLEKLYKSKERMNTYIYEESKDVRGIKYSWQTTVFKVSFTSYLFSFVRSDTSACKGEENTCEPTLEQTRRRYTHPKYPIIIIYIDHFKPRIDYFAFVPRENDASSLYT